MRSPTPAEVRAAREAAGLTQEQAAELAGYGSRPRWVEVETGRRAMEPVRWAYWLHVAGIRRLPWRRRTAQEPQEGAGAGSALPT